MKDGARREAGDLGRADRLRGQHVVGLDLGEGVAVAGLESGRHDGGRGGEVVAEDLGLGARVGGLERHRLQRADGRQPDARPALAEGDGHLGRVGVALGRVGDRVVDRGGHPLEGVVGGTREGVVAGAPHHAVVAVHRRRSGHGCRPARPGSRAGSCRRRWPRSDLALEVDVLAEAGERRGVAPDVEGRLDPVARHGALVVVAGQHGAGREGDPGGQGEHRDGADAPDVRRACRPAPPRWPDGRGSRARPARVRRTPSPGAAATAGGVRRAGSRPTGRGSCRGPGARRPPTRGARAGGRARGRRGPASIPASHGRTSSGPSPSTGGRVVSRSFHPKTAWSATRASVEAPGSSEVSPSERRQSGPPSRKKRTTQMTTAEMIGQPAARVRWVTTTASTTPSIPTTR